MASELMNGTNSKPCSSNVAFKTKMDTLVFQLDLQPCFALLLRTLIQLKVKLVFSCNYSFGILFQNNLKERYKSVQNSNSQKTQ